MLGPIKHYLGVYSQFVANSTALNTGFRTNFFLLIILEIFLAAAKIAGISFIYDHIPTIGSWDREQLIFFLTFTLTIRNLHTMLVFESFWKMALNIRTGQFDFILLKPVHSIFTCFFNYFRPAALFVTPLFVGVLVYYGIQVELTTIDWVILPILIIMSFVLMLVIEFTFSVSVFWLTEGVGINLLRVQIQELSRWPEFVYKGFTKHILMTLLPILLATSAPIMFIYDKNNYPWLIGMLVITVIGSMVLNKLWQVGLKQYESASS